MGSDTETSIVSRPLADINELKQKLQDKNEKIYYINDLGIWFNYINYYKEKRPKLIDQFKESFVNKYTELIQLSQAFTQEEFPQLYRKIQEFRDLLESVGIKLVIMQNEN